MKWHALEEEACSLARAFVVIGDRWSPLILRQCFRRVRRFDGFQEIASDRTIPACRSPTLFEH